MATDSRSFDDVWQTFKQALAARDRHALDRQIDLLLGMDAPLGIQWRSIARISLTNGRIATARAALERYVAHGQSIGDRFEQTVLLAECGDIHSAVRSLRSVPGDYPDPATRAHLEGTLATQSGNLDHAGECFERALAARPTSGITWLSYVQVMRRDRSTRWAERLLDYHRSNPSIAEGDRGPFLYALAEAHHALQDHGAAFAAYVAGGQAVRKQRGIASVLQAELHDRNWMNSAPSGVKRVEDRPIFVLGLPRSGTTLVEQILASHSKISGSGEMTALHLAIDRATRGRALGRSNDRSDALGIFAAEYLQLARSRFPHPGPIVDKTLNVTRYIDWMAAAFPTSPLLYIRRDIVDTAFSCFRTYFSQGIGWSFDLEDIVTHFEYERKILDYSQDRLGDRLTIVNYRDLVERPGTAIRELLDACDLPFEQATLHPDSTDRPVLTASAVQVREPINRRGLGAADPYHTYMAQHLDRLHALNWD